MGRELRFRIQGMIFCVVLISTLSLSSDGIEYWHGIIEIQGNEQGLVISLLGIGIIIFTSEAFGYIFSSIFILFWNKSWKIYPGNIDVLCGYSRHWHKLQYGIKKIISNYYDKEGKSAPTRYEQDILLSYFWFYFIPKDMDDWITRRYTAYFINWACIISIGLAIVLSVLITWQGSLNFNLFYWGVIFFWFLSAIMFYLNCRRALWEILQMIDFWLGSCYDQDIKGMLMSFAEHMKKHNGLGGGVAQPL